MELIALSSEQFVFFWLQPPPTSRRHLRLQSSSGLELEIQSTGTGKLHCKVFSNFVVDLLNQRRTELMDNCLDRLETVAPTL